MSQFPKRGLDLVLRQAHHRCASHPAQGIGGERGLLLRQACASAGALGGGAAAWTDLGRAALWPRLSLRLAPLQAPRGEILAPSTTLICLWSVLRRSASFRSAPGIRAAV